MGINDRFFRNLYHNHVQQHGARVTLLIRAESSYDPATGIVSGGETPLQVYGSRRNYSEKERDGETIRANDFKLHISGTAVSGHEPIHANNIKVSIDNQVYEIVDVTPHYSGGGLVDRYTLQVRA